MLALLSAIEEEITNLQKNMALKKTFPWQDYQIYRGEYRDKAVLLVQTGLGKERAETVTRFMLEHYPVTTLISFGFAGALTEESKIGDIILCSTLYADIAQTDRKHESGNPYYSDASLVSLLLQTIEDPRTRFRLGSSVTSAEPVLSPEAKRALGKAFDADVVDMESYWVAKIASNRHMPFISIRAISDTMRGSLPPFDQILDSNGARPVKKALIYLVSHPQYLIKLFVLYLNARRAKKSLTHAVDRLVVRLGNIAEDVR